jgi:folate-binding protein YgfZ
MSEATTDPVIETPLLGKHKASGAEPGVWFGCLLPDRFGDWLGEYRSARDHVALIDKSYRSYLRFAGPDRVRYLNAILTNNIKDLSPRNAVVSLLLSPQGRIQAEIETYAEPESLVCVSFASIRTSLAAALEKYIIMDDVTLTDESDRYGTLALEGPAAADAVRALTGVDLGELAELSFRDSAAGQIPLVLARRSPGGVPGAEFRALREDLEPLWDLLLDAVRARGGQAVGYRALNALRLEQGIPWFGYDFGDRQIPHEAGLEHSHISYSKGCYTGQEIVERVRARGQVNRVRTLLQLTGGEAPAPGSTLTAGGTEAGYLTRAAFSPQLQAVIAMGYVRREQSSIGAELACGSERATIIQAPLTA